MTTIATALTSLGIKKWVLQGEPTTETEFNAMFRKVTGSKNGSPIESSDPSDFGTTWKAVSDKKTELINAEPMRLLRLERNRLLAETDWMASSDLTLASNWKTYRQQLRDLPSSASPKLTSGGLLDLSSVTFPTKPS
jgi:hypothetical protein